VGLLSAFAAIAVAVLAYLLWRRRAYEVVDLTDARKRRSSAARWMAEGEADKAEEMLRAAVDILEGWPKALAHADLGSLLMALERDADAITELEAACALGSRSPDQQEEMLEFRIRLSRLLSRAGQEEAAERVLIEAEAVSEEPIFSALRAEALAELYIDQGKAEKVVAILEPVFTYLAKSEHDRAAAVAVTLAFARHKLGADAPWQSLDMLADDLKSSVVLNFCDRLPSIEEKTGLRLLEPLLDLLLDLPDFRQECHQLRSVASDISGDDER
jgi:tetratricopeptide (TPR) repeat protein